MSQSEGFHAKGNESIGFNTLFTNLTEDQKKELDKKVNKKMEVNKGSVIKVDKNEEK